MTRSAQCSLRQLLIFCLFCPLHFWPAVAQSQESRSSIHIDTRKVISHITPYMTGSCIEDVNHEIYGGLYDQRIFGESFEEPVPPVRLAGWTAYGGAWSATGNVCRTRAAAGGKLVLDASDSADVTIDVDVLLPTNLSGNAGVLVRVQNPGVGADAFDGYEISLDTYEQRLILGKHRHDWQPITTTACLLLPGQWHHLRINLDGARLRCSIDGAATPQIDFTDYDRPILSGVVALRSWNADAEFRGLRLISRDTGTTISPGFRPVADTDSISGLWDAVRTGSTTAQFFCDLSNAFQGEYSQKITHGPGTGTVGVANRGLNRWGIAVRKGQRYVGHFYVRGHAADNRLIVALQSADGRSTYAQATVKMGGDSQQTWRKASFVLDATETDSRARFALWLDQPGTVGVDQVVLMADSAARFHGLPVRADIGNAIVQEGITFLRYGGTMVNVPGYRWKNMIGDRDRRPPYRGNWYPYSTNGFGIFDFLDFCERGHLAAAFAINCEETDADASDLADYLTAPVTNPWGQRRANDGHPEPYNVRYIEIGNEEVIGGDQASGYAHYAARFRALAQAIHRRNATIPLVCAAWWRPDSPNIRAVFDAVNGEAAAWDLHVNSDAADAGSDIDRQITQMQTLFQSWNPKTNMRAVIFEENGDRHDLQRALGHATTLNATRRHGDFVLADCPANCLQPLGQNDNGWNQGQIFFTPDKVWGMPPYYAQQMAARNAEPLCVESRVVGAPTLDVLATRSEDSQTLVLSVVNTGTAPITATIDAGDNVGAMRASTVWTLDAASRFGQVTGPTDLATMPSQTLAVAQPLVYRFPPFSYTVIRLMR